jgi:hypothetical protein
LSIQCRPRAQNILSATNRSWVILCIHFSFPWWLRIRSFGWFCWRLRRMIRTIVIGNSRSGSEVGEEERLFQDVPENQTFSDVNFLRDTALHLFQKSFRTWSIPLSIRSRMWRSSEKIQGLLKRMKPHRDVLWSLDFCETSICERAYHFSIAFALNSILRTFEGEGKKLPRDLHSDHSWYNWETILS